MTRSLLCGALLAALLAACAAQPPLYRSVGSTPIGTDASTGRPSVSGGLAPGGIIPVVLPADSDVIGAAVGV